MNHTPRMKEAEANSTAAKDRYAETTVPYYFSSLARERGQDLKIGDYVRVLGLDNKYELVDILRKNGFVRIRAIGEIECLGMPWRFIEPWEKSVIKSKTMMQTMGDVLFTGNRVYRLAEPDRVLWVKKIHWNREKSDLEDERGRVYRDVSWDDMEFWDDVEFHFAGEE